MEFTPSRDVPAERLYNNRRNTSQGFMARNALTDSRG
jgi:hypothetical protein